MALKLVALFACIAASAAIEAISIKPDCTGANRYGECPYMDQRILYKCYQYAKRCDDDLPCPMGYKCCALACSRECVPACSVPCWSGEVCQLQYRSGELPSARAQCVPDGGIRVEEPIDPVLVEPAKE